MKLQSIKLLACIALFAMSCVSCKANCSSEASGPKKTLKSSTSQSTVQSIVTNNGLLQVVEVESKKMGRNISNLVVLPEDYFEETNNHYPVLYLLHGYSGNHMAWQEHVDLTKYATKFHFIIVCPDGQDSWYFDSPIDPAFQFETYITQELRAYIENNYRVVNDRKYRAVTGLSMGGHGALWLAWRHPEIYGMCGSMSGGVDITTIKNRYKIDKRLGKYANNAASWKSHSVINLVPSIKQEDEQFIIIDDGTSDIFIKDNRALHAALKKHKIKHEYRERPGRHSWDYWVESLNQHLTAFSNRIHLIKMGDC